MPTSHEFARFIDDLRDSRNMSREVFTDNIISLRQYYRFINGTSSLKNETISQLLERLEVDVFDTYTKFIHSNNDIKLKLFKAYDLMRDNKYEKSIGILSSINHNDIILKEDLKFYMFILNYSEYCSDKSKTEETISNIIDILNYPEIMKKRVLNSYEFTGLLALSSHIIAKDNDYSIANYLYEILVNKDSSLYSNMPNHLLAIYVHSSKMLGRTGEYEKSLILSEEGLKLSVKTANFSQYVSLLYLKALGQYSVDDNEYIVTLRRLFTYLYSLNNPDKKQLYHKLIKEHFDIEEKDLVIYKPTKK